MNLEFPQIEVTENGGPIVLAHLARCTCGTDSDVFHIFQIAGQAHFHIECTQCETSYCPFGVCKVPEKAKATSLVHEREGVWFFWSEDGVDEYGPFPDELTAHKEMGKYYEWLNSGRSS